MHSALREAVEGGLVLRTSRSYAFAHDRVHEAAYALVPPLDRAATHLQIGRTMVAVTAGTDAGERIFEIVNQFARGLPAIALDSEREMVAELYLAAGRRAKGSSAYASALAYFSSGRTLLGDHAWARRSDLTLELELNCAECEIIVGELATAEDRLARLAPHVTRLPDQVQVVIDGPWVVLRGSVANDREARVVEGMVRLTPGVRGIRNELQPRGEDD